MLKYESTMGAASQSSTAALRHHAASAPVVKSESRRTCRPTIAMTVKSHVAIISHSEICSSCAPDHAISSSAATSCVLALSLTPTTTHNGGRHFRAAPAFQPLSCAGCLESASSRSGPAACVRGMCFARGHVRASLPLGHHGTRRFTRDTVSVWYDTALRNANSERQAAASRPGARFSDSSSQAQCRHPPG